MHIKSLRESRSIDTAVVTGPTGAIGMALCQKLVSQNIKVFAVVNPSSARKKQLSGIEGIGVVDCDASDIVSLQSFINSRRIDAFFHLSWKRATGSGRNDMYAQIENIANTVNACRVAKALGCSVFIGAGSQAEYGRTNEVLAPSTPCFPENGYGMAKLCAGQMSRVECEKLGVDHIWTRILSVYGPYDGRCAMLPQLIQSLLVGNRLPLTSGEQLWDYLYSGDAAEALLRLALFGHSGAVYVLGSGHARPIREYVEETRDAIDRLLPLGFGEVPYGPQQVMHLEADISALVTDTGFSPAVSFEEGIEDTIAYERSLAE